MPGRPPIGISAGGDHGRVEQVRLDRGGAAAAANWRQQPSERGRHEEGRHVSKAAAAEWALGRDPTLGVVGDALRRRHGDPAARIDPAQVARLLAVVRARVAEARDGT